MAKLIYKYGAMNSGKTTLMLQTAFNYEERNQKVVLAKSIKDTKGEDYVVSRIGISRKIDEFIRPDDKIVDVLEKYLDNVSCIIIDEAQFLFPNQVKELYYIAKLYDIPVIGFGLRANFKMEGFDGSPTFMLLADEVIEFPTICRCGKKARLNARKRFGEFVVEGEDIVIDGSDEDTEYESLCGECYLKYVMKADKSNIKRLIYK